MGLSGCICRAVFAYLRPWAWLHLPDAGVTPAALLPLHCSSLLPRKHCLSRQLWNPHVHPGHLVLLLLLLTLRWS